jgi:2-polyprenyl-6-methoxyphenol hydroxylase-like FAD-dependent oxidoreductase
MAHLASLDMPMNDPQVIVVGAGPAGMILGLLLSRSGISVRVMEQATTFAREFRGEILQPGVIRILGDLGLRDRILALGGRFPSGIDIQYDRKTVSFDIPPALEPTLADGLAIVPQQQFLEMLASEAARRINFELTMGCSVRELLADSHGVSGVCGQLSDGGSVALHARLVVACDGRFSAIRRAADIKVREVPIPFDLLWFSTPIPNGFSNRVYVRITQNQLFVSFASRSNRMQVGWLIHKGDYARFRAQPFDKTLDHIISHVPVQLTETVRESLHGWHDLSLLPVVSQVAERWSQPGLLLLGDAAHPMSPAGGQGINVAIYDAVVAARILVPALDAGLSLDDAVCAIENERRPAAARTQRLQNMLTGVLNALGPGMALRLATTLILAGARTPWRPRLLTRAIDRFLWGYPEVRADKGPWIRN